MKLNVDEDGLIELKEVFNPVVFVTENGEELYVCMRDDGFEIGLRSKEQTIWFYAENEKIEKL